MQTLERRLEFAILSVLVHYDGVYEDSLVEWFSAFRLGLPQLKDMRQLREVFKLLSERGIIALNRPGGGPFRFVTQTDDSFFGGEPFMTTLTPLGLIHWNTVRVQPDQPSAF